MIRKNQYCPGYHSDRSTRSTRFGNPIESRTGQDAGEPGFSGPPRDRPSTRRRVKPVLIPASLALVIILSVLIIQPWRVDISTTRDAVAEDNRLAVMYFENLNDPRDSLRLGEILTSLLIADMAESRFVQVVSSQRLYDILKILGHEGVKGVSPDVATQVARKAGARWMLMGNILQTEPHLVVTAQLIDITTGNVAASQRAVGAENEDVFSFIDRLSIEVKHDLPLPPAARSEWDRPVTEVTTNSREAYRYYVEGLDLFNKHYRLEAAEKFRNALQFDSTFAMAYYYLAQSGSMSHLAGADRYIENAGERDGHYIRSLKAWVSGNAHDAIDELRRLITRYPDEKEAWLNIGQYYFYLERYHEALTYLGKVIEMDPFYKQAYNYTAYAYAGLDNFERALVTVNSYIAAAPNEANPYDTRAEILSFSGRIDEAIASYERALQIKPDFAASMSDLAHLYIFKGEFDVAETRVWEFIDTFQDISPYVWMSLAMISMYQGKLQETLAKLDDCIEKELRYYGAERNPHHHYLKAHIYSALGRYDSALVEVERAGDIIRQFVPQSLDVFLREQARWLAESGDLESAQRTVSELQALIGESDYRDYHLEFSRGTIELARGNYSAAITHFENIHFLNGIAFSRDYFLAQAHLFSGHPDRAIPLLEKLLVYHGYWRAYLGIWFVKSHYYLGLAYEQTGQYDRAIANYEKFLDIWRNADPELPEIDDARARLARVKNRP